MSCPRCNGRRQIFDTSTAVDGQFHNVIAHSFNGQTIGLHIDGEPAALIPCPRCTSRLTTHIAPMVLELAWATES